jgi:hypothetical protein
MYKYSYILYRLEEFLVMKSLNFKERAIESSQRLSKGVKLCVIKV